MKTVIVKEKGKYYKVPINVLHTIDNRNSGVRTGYPVIQYIQRGNNISVKHNIKRINIPIRVDYRDYKTWLCRELRIKENGKEWKAISGAIQHSGGLRFKTKKGVHFLTVATMKGKGYKFNLSKLKILNPITNNSMKLPNIYNRGNICWGNVERFTEKESLYDGVDYFFDFFTTEFNNDLNNAGGSNIDRLKEWLGMKESNIRGETGVINEAKRVLIEKVGKSNITSVNTFVLLIIATIFDEDNVIIDSLVG